MKDQNDPANGKFEDPYVTADGSDRASVALTNPKTLWFNTGTLCNIECLNCYIESSPTNERLVYLSTAEVEDYLQQIADREWPITEIGFTGGEPFMNPDMIAMMEASLKAGFEVLVLTNAMRPMMRKRVQAGLLDLNARFPGKITLRVSLDHYAARHHDEERGAGSFDISIIGMDWLRDNGIQMAVAGRTMWGEAEAEARDGFARLFAARGYAIDAQNPMETVLFPEMDASVPVPEITHRLLGHSGQKPR